MTEPEDREAFLAELRREYVDSARDRMERLDELLDRLHMGAGTEADVRELHREVHSLKGSAGTYGFPAISTIAHRMEDYMETSPDLHAPQLDDLGAFLDGIRPILAAEIDPDDAALERLLADLPSSAQSDPQPTEFTEQKVREIRVLLVMPRDIQRKIIGTELAGCGLHVAVADQGSEALARALADKPDIVVTAMELPDMSGTELSQIFHVLDRLDGCRLIVLTSYDLAAPQVRALPGDVAVVRKGEPFIEDLSRCLIEWRILS